MAITVLLEINVNPDSADAVKDTLKDMLGATRAFDGCISIDAIQSQESPGTFMLIERWTSSDHHARYNAWRAETGAADDAAAKLAATYSLRYFDPVDA